ncbi:MAG: TonB-dependent receptor [Gammaproteobacteria bacterium]|nr:TonB-dependent receptor [Gammaproteobacteria bacterium]
MSTFKNVTRISAAASMGFAVLQALPIVASAQIEEVVVSTRRREESLQDVPIAVSALTTEQIERQGISDLKDIVANQPSVQFDQAYGPGDNRITIRGLSNTRGRSNVAFLVDGIDTTTENLIAAGSGLLANRRLLTDVERIEIVKGPQSALFGRAAFAGAFNYITKEPGDEFDGRVSLDIGDYGRRTIDGAFGGPLSDTVGLRITGVRYNEDGFYTNQLLGTDVGGTDGYGGALTVVWKPADPIKVKGRVEYSEDNFDPRAVVRIDGDTQYALPEDGKVIPRPIITGNPDTQQAASSGTNLYNFGAYCSTNFDPFSTPPGDGSGASFCLPGEIGKSRGYRVWQSEDANTGEAFPGTTTETFRASLVASFDLGYGLISSYTGWTDFAGHDEYDQDYQASNQIDFNGNGGRPYSTSDPRGGRIDTLMGHQEANTDADTKQFSQEFRFETQLDGPVQFTGGVLFWQEERQLDDRNNITFCAPYGRDSGTVSPLLDSDGNPVFRDGDPGPDVVLIPVGDPTTGTLVQIAGACDGGLVNPALPFNQTTNPFTVDSWQEYRRQVSDPQYAARWEADTRHLSFYGRVDWNITEDLELSIEDRFVDEEFSLTKPGTSSCTEIGFYNNGNPVSLPREPVTLCDIERLANGEPVIDAATGKLALRYIEGSTYSSYNTPKVTLAWKASDDTNYYFSYAFAQKPGGINQLAGGGGGEPPPIEAERFNSEKLKAWELGVKTRFEAAGFWSLNSSIFFQDYTDKQVGIQIVAENGVSQPRVVNVDGTQVWGGEFEALWQPSFMEGLSLSLSGTILDAKYTDWVDDTRNLVKVAVYGSCPAVFKRGDVESTDPNDPAFGGAVPTAFCRLDYSGNELERSPKQSYAAQMSIQRPFLDTPFEYLFEMQGSWQDERWADPENLVKLADYARLNMRLGLISDKWEVIGYVDNVLDDDRFTTAGSGPDFGTQATDLGFTAGFGTTHYFASLPDPRVFGIRGSYRFGGGR